MGKRYDKEFKIEAVRLASELGNKRTQVQRYLDIGKGMIDRWKRELKLDLGHDSPTKRNQGAKQGGHSFAPGDPPQRQFPIHRAR